MIPKIEVWMHDMSVGYPVWFEVDSQKIKSKQLTSDIGRLL
ncbi:hypothetical protein ACQUI5_001224 [Enterococcus faecalis]